MEFKKCSGYHGKCYHSDDMIVPVHMFSKVLKGEDKLAGMCKTCAVEQHKKADPISNAVSRKAYEIAGGQDNYFAMLKVDRFALRDQARVELGHNVTQLPPALPRFDDGSPSTVRTSKLYMPSGATREGPGFVYIYQDERIPEDLKIGAEKVSQGRLAGAGTWGLYRCVFNAPFESRFEAEREVHKILAKKRIVSNKEIFKCSVQEAQVAIETVALRLRVTGESSPQQGVK